MFGKNPIRKPVTSSGDILQIQEIFPTIQGEGPLVGMASVFVRLGGCNLACSFCDTEFESFSEMNIKDIISEIKNCDIYNLASQGKMLVVITGGEPFRQPLEKLVDELIKLNYQIQIETNGTIYRQINEKAKIICSPKNTGNGYHKIREDLLSRIDALKFIVSKNNILYQNIEDVGQSDYNIPVYIQPMDEYDENKNKENTEYAVDMALRYGYRLSIQLHKYIGVK